LVFHGGQFLGFTFELLADASFEMIADILSKIEKFKKG
jgi:hypothetical protein